MSRVEGFAAVPNWIARNPSIHPYAKVIYLVLASHTGIEGAWFMSHQEIADEVGCSEKTVRTHLETLIELGLVKRTARVRQDGSTAANLYEIVVTKGMRRPVDNVAQDDPDMPPVSVDNRAEERVPAGHSARYDVPTRSVGDTEALGSSYRARRRTTPIRTTQPNPPTPRADAQGAACARHRDAPGPNCRACGTNKRALQTVAPPAPRRPRWCRSEQCDQRTRMREDPETARPYPCPACHPQSLAAWDW